jgi:hypothetical protein
MVFEPSSSVNSATPPRKKCLQLARYIVRLLHARSETVEQVPFGIEAKARDLYEALVHERRPELICVAVTLHEVLPDRSKRLLACHRGDAEACRIRAEHLAARKGGRQ